MIKPTLTLGDVFPAVTREAWRQRLDKDLRGAPFEKRLVTTLLEGIAQQPLYSHMDWPGEADPGGHAGFRPMRRGAQPLGNSREGWDIRQRVVEAQPKAAQHVALEELRRGATSLTLALDAAARRGEMADATTLGCEGVAIHTLDDLQQVLEGVHLTIAPLGVDAGISTPAAAAMVAAMCTRRGDAWTALRGTWGGDPLACLAREGRLPCSVDEALAQLGALAKWSVSTCPGMRSVQVDTGVFHDAGCHDVHALAFAMAAATTYLRVLTDAGLSLDDACRQIAFHLRVDSDFFKGIAKLRAARVLWSRVTEVCGASVDASRMHLQVSPAGRTLTTRDPWVNMLRTTVSVFAAAIGGADVVSATSFDAALGSPGALGRRVARNTQLMLQQESNLHRVVDPAGGSWYLESMTDALAERAWVCFQDIESRGGWIEVLRSGWVAATIETTWQQRARNVATRKTPSTGVSIFPALDEDALNVATLDPTWRDERVAALERAKRVPTLPAVADPEWMAALIAAAPTSSLAALVEASCTTTSDVSMTPLPRRRLAAPFEALRSASDQHLADRGTRPRVFLANLGPIAEHTARATFAKNVVEAGGFEALTNDGFATPAAAAEAFAASGTDIAVVCSSDARYAEHAAATFEALQGAGGRCLILAGRPGEHETAFKAAGMTDAMYLGCDVLALLNTLWAQVERTQGDEA